MITLTIGDKLMNKVVRCVLLLQIELCAAGEELTVCCPLIDSRGDVLAACVGDINIASLLT